MHLLLVLSNLDLLLAPDPFLLLLLLQFILCLLHSLLDNRAQLLVLLLHLLHQLLSLGLLTLHLLQ